MEGCLLCVIGMVYSTAIDFTDIVKHLKTIVTGTMNQFANNNY